MPIEGLPKTSIPTSFILVNMRALENVKSGKGRTDDLDCEPEGVEIEEDNAGVEVEVEGGIESGGVSGDKGNG